MYEESIVDTGSVLSRQHVVVFFFFCLFVCLCVFFFLFLCFFFFNDTATTEIYTLSLHDALPIFQSIVVSEGSRNPILLTASDFDNDVLTFSLVDQPKIGRAHV